jgi:hypothetical protein
VDRLESLHEIITMVSKVIPPVVKIPVVRLHPGGLAHSVVPAASSRRTASNNNSVASRTVLTEAANIIHQEHCVQAPAGFQNDFSKTNTCKRMLKTIKSCKHDCDEWTKGGVDKLVKVIKVDAAQEELAEINKALTNVRQP